MLWEVTQTGHVLSPPFRFINESGDVVFGTIDLNHGWKGKILPLERFRITAWLQGNLLAVELFYAN